MPTLSVILPTYNEATNMALIIPALTSVFRANQLDAEIIVVDDNSPDGTIEVVNKLAHQYPVRAHKRLAQRGLAASVIEGFQIAKGEILIVMDADLSHPVDRIPAMLEPILNNEADITVGSRYIKGGGCSDWSWIRRVVSRGAGLLARGITPLSDPTTGFMAVRKSIVENIELNPVGWKIVLETVIKTQAPTKEIPIIFCDRQHGESKLTASVQLLYLLHLWKLYGFRRPNFMQFLRFCMVGFSGVFVDTAALVIAVEYFAINKVVAGGLSFLCAVTWNFFLNRSWTFDNRNTRQLPISFLLFVAVCSLGLCAKVLVMDLLIEFAGFDVAFWYIAASLLGIAVSTAVNYFGSRRFVFG